MDKPIIALDAGHGMNTAGKRCMKSLDPDQTREWWLNDRVMDKVQAMLSEYDCIVIRTDDTTGVKDISLSARCQYANSAGADVFVSTHHNAGINGRKGGGTVVFHYGSTVRQNQAQRLYNSIIARTGLVGNRSQKVIKKSYYVLKHTKMAAFLIENGFMDSPSDVPIILTDAHARKTAEGVVDFLVKEYSLQKKTGQNRPQENPQGALYYPAYTGAKTTLSIALRRMGIDYSYEYRKKIAAVNNIAGYSGTASQNTHMYNLLVSGKLISVESGTSQNRPQTNEYYPAYTGKKTTLSSALVSLGIDYSYNFRKKIAEVNGIKNYRGTAAQNTQMYNLLVAGILKKVN